MAESVCLPSRRRSSNLTGVTKNIIMNTKLTFKERARLGVEQQAKQQPVTLELAIQQAKNISLQSKRRK